MDAEPVSPLAVAVHAADREALSARVHDAGWRVAERGEAAILIVEVRGDAPAIEPAPPAECAIIAIATDAAAAYAAGATHWLPEGFDDRTLADALRFAGRHARRMLRLPFERRRHGGDRADASAAARRPVAPDDARLARDVPEAIGRGEIDVVFQPQATVATGAIVGVEALARWEHRDLGEVGAEALFAAADRAGLSGALSAHVQAHALASAAAWPPALARLRLSLNVTAADIARGDFAEALLARIAASGFPRARVTVEIVETGVIEDLTRAGAILQRLRGAGCRIAIDDFGTGYASLAWLQALPIDYLKIDRALIAGIDRIERDRTVVRGVLAMARSLGVETIAEGVERETQRLALAADGADLYQGFLCAGGIPADALARLVPG